MFPLAALCFLFIRILDKLLLSSYASMTHMDHLLGAIETHETAALVGSLGLTAVNVVRACSEKAAVLSAYMNSNHHR